MEHRRQGDTQFVAAAKAGFSERSARRIEAAGAAESTRPEASRSDPAGPLADVWRS